MRRTTYVVSDRLAVRRVRDATARGNRLGHRVLTLPGLAARLAGGFRSVLGADHVQSALQQRPLEGLGSLAPIADLPGFARAAGTTLRLAWSAGIDLGARSAEPTAHGRWAELKALEARVRSAAPSGALLPPELVRAATERVHLAPRLVGELRLERVYEVPPLYRPLLTRLAEHVAVSWVLPHGTQAAWAHGTGIALELPEPQSPELSLESCAEPAHEALVALRWVRQLLVQGVPAEQIAVAAVDVGTYDDAVQSLAQSARLPVHFAQGVSLLGTHAGQFAAAMADALLNGPNQARVRRLLQCAAAAGDQRLGALPAAWCKDLNPDAALNSVAHWARALEPLGAESPAVAGLVLRLVTDLSAGPGDAAAVGGRWLTGTAQEAWSAALAAGPAEALPSALHRTRVNDDSDPANSVIWASAAALIGWPRPYVRLLGLSARAWPRRSSDEDPLLPHRVLGSTVLREVSTARRDTDHLTTLIAQTSTQVVLSLPRRGSDGRKQSPSPLLGGLPISAPVHEHLPRLGAPHALNEADRRTSRPAELTADPAMQRARAAFRSYNQARLTPHDGLVRASHPVVTRALGRRHSATSLKKLLRNPHGFIASYALGWAEPRPETDVLELDPPSRGSLIHEVLEASLGDVQARGGFAAVDREALQEIVEEAADRLATTWEMSRPVPPPIAWNFELRRAVRIALEMLTFPDVEGGGTLSYAEVKFGYAPTDDGELNGRPWRPDAVVTIPGTDLRLRGVIDRLDLDQERKFVRVIDYKTGRYRRFDGPLGKGAELQRTLYSIAVKQLLGQEYTVEAGLLYAGRPELEALDDPDASVEQLTDAVLEAVRLLASGDVLPGPDVTDTYEETVLAYPAVGTAYYYRMKGAALEERRRVLDTLLLGPQERVAEVQA